LQPFQSRFGKKMTLCPVPSDMDIYEKNLFVFHLFTATNHKVWNSELGRAQKKGPEVV